MKYLLNYTLLFYFIINIRKLNFIRTLKYQILQYVNVNANSVKLLKYYLIIKIMINN